MSISRRLLLTRVFLIGVTNLLLAPRDNAHAENIQYVYDELGRLTRATYPNGVTVDYSYDAAGNRTQVVRAGGASPPPSPPPGGFSATIAITGTGPVNLRALADAAGYTGAQNATVTFTLASGVAIAGAAGAPSGGVAVDTGVWPTTTFAISLTLQISGKIYGGGGVGGAGAGFGGQGDAPGEAGGVGGDALYCRLPITLVVNSGGELKAGGGGGGGGGAWRNSFTDPTSYYGGGGGGGGFANGNGGSAGVNNPEGGPESNSGAAGSGVGGGAGGANGGAIGSGRTPGNGGAGGNAASIGASGTAATGTASGTWSKLAPGAGGAAGYAIRKNGHAVSVTNNGTITGTQG